MKTDIPGYTVIPSVRQLKKYDVYKDGKYLLSYGDIRYGHYYDKFKFYSDLDHLDDRRRYLYRIRHQYDHIKDPNYPGFWSYHYLW